MEKEYADAVIQALGKGIDESRIVDNLMAHLKEEGRLKLLPVILRELKRVQARTEVLAPSIEAATEGEKDAARKGAASAGIEASEVTVNSDLIRGWRARSGSRLVDHSAKQALVGIYQKITN